jgi:2-polyprenyl-3-methyl-5-hydroxy-6-metoxy-1,4-benzoquinol methylase
MKVLAAIANHGTGNRVFLDQLLGAHRESSFETRVVVLSNIDKDVGGDVEVRVGVPSRNPWSLPFAHRELFREEIEKHDLFIYTEDDTLLRERHLSAFQWAESVLHKDEIAGFLRTERDPDGNVYYSSCHSFFRWIPDSVRERGGALWARYSNEHSACFVATREQIQNGIEVGGFGREPHEGRYDMLCAAATDIYANCGFERLICLDRLEDFSIEHLPNKYIGKMGLAKPDLMIQLEALRQVYMGKLPRYELLEPETKLPGSRGAKHFYEKPDARILAMVDSAASVLSWGCGSGALEEPLVSSGVKVVGVPLDAVIGSNAQRRGLEMVYGPEDVAMEQLKGAGFEAVILSDILHLVDDEDALLSGLFNTLAEGGRLVCRVPNFFDLGMLRRRFTDERYRMAWNKERVGAGLLQAAELKQLAEGCGFREVEVSYGLQGRRQSLSAWSMGLLDQWLGSHVYLFAIR